MDYMRESLAKLSHEQGKHFYTPNVRPNAHFSEELSTFTSRVVRAENASAKHINTRNCGDVKNQELAATKSQMRCTPNSYTQTGADQGLEHIVLDKIYYAIRNDSEDVFVNPCKERLLGAGNNEYDESQVQREAREGSDRYFGGSTNDYREDNKEGQEENELARNNCERSNVRHKWPIQEVHSSLPEDEYEQPFQTRLCDRRTVMHVHHQSSPNKEVSSRLHRPSLLGSDCQVQDCIVIADSPPRAADDDYKGTGQNTSWEFPDVSSSDKRFGQAQIRQDTNFHGIRNQYSADNSVGMSAVSEQNGGMFVYPFLTQNGNCAANGVASDYETPSSSMSKGESDMNFLKLRNTVEQVVLEQIRRQMENTGETGEAQMLVRVAEDILSKAKDMGRRAKYQTQTAEIAKSTNNPTEIVRPVGEERSAALSALTRQDHPLVSQSMTSPPIAEKTRPTTTTSPQVNGEYPQGSVIRNVLEFSREASKRTRQSLGDVCSQEIIRPKYVRKESMSELRAANERDSPDSRTDLHYPQEVSKSSQQVRHRQSEWIEQDVVVVENTSSWRSNSGKQQDEESEFREDIEKDTTLQRVTEEDQEEIVCNVTNERLASPSGSAFRLFQSNPNREDLTYAGELNKHSPFIDDCVEIHRSPPAEMSQQSTPTPLHSEGDSFGQPLDGISGLTSCVDEGCKFPASIFKQARTMRQDIHATFRVFSTLFQPFSCSQRYTAASHQSRGSNQKSGHSTPNSRATRLIQDSQNSQTSSSAEEGHPRDSQEQHMGCSSHTHEDCRDQNVQILSVCSLQNNDTYAPGNVETPRSGLPADSGNETSTIEETTENQTGGSDDNPPSCFGNLTDNSPETSNREEMAEVLTVAAEDAPCFDNLGHNSLRRAEGKEMRHGLPGDPPSRFENLSDISQETSSREDKTVMPSEGAEEDVSLKETSSDCGQLYSKRSQSSCAKCCNGSLDNDKTYLKISKELLNATKWTNAKLFVCPWLSCDRRFKRNDELTRHWHTHTGEKPYPCSMCKKSFGRRDGLGSHMKTTHVDKVEMGCTQSKSIQS